MYLAPRVLQRFALKPEPVKFLKGLQSKPFKNFTVVRLSAKRCNKPKNIKSALRADFIFLGLLLRSNVSNRGCKAITQLNDD